MKGESPIFRALKNLTWLTQLGISMLTPLFMCLFAALWLQRKFALGDWVVLAGLVIGLISGAQAFISFLKFAHREIKK